jgi:glycosyltransferase involved in cell wall biosynthesis
LANTLVCGCLDDLNYVIQQKLFHSLYAECIAPGIEENFHQIPFQAIKEKAIIYIGSWIPRKGIQLIPAVIHTILKNNATYEFRVFGAWDSKLEILEQFDLNVRNRVKVFDKLSSNLLVSEITKAAIFFFPTYSEGFGLATVEAMCCSCAVVTTPTGIGCNLINNKQALICDFNDISAMQAAIQTLIDDELFRQEIALGGYSKAKSFNWQTQIEKLHTTYKKWLHLFAANV